MTVTTQQTLDEDEVFLDLALADDDLVRAEFDALIAACWESPCEPPRDKTSPPAGAWAPRPPSMWPRPPVGPLGPVPARRPLGRERGPPLRRSD
jgi:hypothetical protein